MLRTTAQNDFRKDALFSTLQTQFSFFDLDEYADDFGHITHLKPAAVFMPDTVNALQDFLLLTNKYHLKIICRGRGNSAYGQTQLKNGIVVDLSNLDIPMTIDSQKSTITVPGFKTWEDVTALTLKHEKTVPVTIDNLDLTVAGTLSFGALGGTSYRVGSGADNVVELDVVTPDGKRQTCSKEINRDLFEAVLCDMGQFGFIISATIPLIEAKQNVSLHLLSYSNVEEFIKAQKIYILQKHSTI